LVMAFPSTNIIQRWDLITKEKELTVPLDIQAPSMVLMGSASQGPVLAVGGKNDFRGGAHKFLNLATFKEVTLGKEGNFGWRGFHPGYTRVSANGLVFSTWDPGSSPQGLQSYVLGGNSLKSHYQHKSMGHITPGPDGKVLYTSSGRFTAECNPLGGAMENRDDYVVPSVQGDFFLTLKMANRFGGRGKNNVDTNTLSIHLGSDTRPLLNIPDILQTPANDPLGAVNRWDREKFGNDKRFHFIPDADLLVVIPLTNDRLDLRRVNIEQSLEKAGIDYLYVTSRAPEAVQRGTTYQYKLAVKSKKGGLKYKLDSGPQGMKISTDGTVVWKTAADQDLIDESVLVTVSDAAGQEVFHTFKVRVVADPLPKEVAKEAPKDLKFEEPKKEIGKGFDPPKVKSAPVGDIRPVKLGAERVERMLPDTISDICVGGGGRYLLVTLSGQRKVALFDANEGKIVHYFPLASDNARVTAGKEHLVIAYLDTGIFQRWSLATKEKELTVNAPFTEQVKSITMGHNSLGPIFVAFKESGFQRGMPRFLDLKFKDAGIPINGRSTNDPAFPHANADGTLFGFRHGVGGEGHESGLVHVHGKTAKAISIWCATSILLGSPDGRFVYAGTCVYNSDLKPVHPLKEVTQFAKPYLPAVHGPYFMRLDYKQWDQHGGSLALFFQGNYTPFATINNIDGVSNEAISYGSNRDKLTHSQRIFLIPAAKLLVSVPKTNDRLVLHQVDVNELLEKSPIDYLLIASQPPTSITASQNLTYKLDVRSKKGGLKFTLDAGPKGMSISPQGELTWNVPADAAAGDENIIVTIRDAAGQEIFHTFRLSVEAK
ncbi:MAG TPA: putative Ig domain-containing protein, partial [Gemmataceae bacterium]|nr:putative Ig domain-containing protein [Gemmataceae bacterium]